MIVGVPVETYPEERRVALVPASGPHLATNVAWSGIGVGVMVGVGVSVGVRVADGAGMGIPQEFDFRNTDSLGLQLVNSLAAQLGGAVELDRTNRTTFTITFMGRAVTGP